MSQRVAVLFVDPRGAYSRVPDVDLWCADRDARAYQGPWPVVAHPPCASWGAYSKPSPTSSARGPLRGCDAGAFRAALAAVQTWGGVIEHPARSHAWAAHGLPRPGELGTWVKGPREFFVGYEWAAAVDQGHYGHAARKPTWLYFVGWDPLPLLGGAATPPARGGSSPRRGILERMSKKQREATPPEFRDLLLRLVDRDR